MKPAVPVTRTRFMCCLLSCRRDAKGALSHHGLATGEGPLVEICAAIARVETWCEGAGGIDHTSLKLMISLNYLENNEALGHRFPASAR